MVISVSIIFHTIVFIFLVFVAVAATTGSWSVGWLVDCGIVKSLFGLKYKYFVSCFCLFHYIRVFFLKAIFCYTSIWASVACSCCLVQKKKYLHKSQDQKVKMSSFLLLLLIVDGCNLMLFICHFFVCFFFAIFSTVLYY